MTPILSGLNRLTLADRSALAAYCAAYARLVAAERVLEVEGMTFETNQGYIGQRPEVAIAAKSMTIIKMFCAEFGLTPGARARMALPEERPADDRGFFND